MEATPDETARALELEIEHDREDLDRTLTHLQEKLSVEHLVDETRGYLAECLQSVRELVGRHPMPVAAVAGLAVGTMIGRRRAHARATRVMQANGGRELERLIEAIVDRAVEAAKASTNGASSVRNGNDDAPDAAEVMRRVTELMEEAQRRIQKAGNGAQEAIADLARAQPVMLGTLGLVLGGAIAKVLSRR